jgi:hypothetical protein
MKKIFTLRTKPLLTSVVSEIESLLNIEITRPKIILNALSYATHSNELKDFDWYRFGLQTGFLTNCDTIPDEQASSITIVLRDAEIECYESFKATLKTVLPKIEVTNYLACGLACAFYSTLLKEAENLHDDVDKPLEVELLLTDEEILSRIVKIIFKPRGKNEIQILKAISKALI